MRTQWALSCQQKIRLFLLNFKVFEYEFVLCLQVLQISPLTVFESSRYNVKLMHYSCYLIIPDYYLFDSQYIRVK